MTPKVSIIFPTFNGWQDTMDCLESIKGLNYPASKLEVIVIDNGSSDKTLKEIPNYKLQITSYKFLKNEKNLGFAKAVNKGIKEAKGDYFLITNNDVIFDKDYLKNLIEFSLANPIAGIVGGKVYYKKPKNTVAFGGAKFDFYTGILKPNKTPNQISETDWVSGCNLLVSRKTLEEIGLFDEKFFFYFEDLDLSLRAKKTGYKVLYYPKAIMYHGEGASIKREGWQRNSQVYYEGKTRILLKHANKIQLASSLVFQFTIGMLFQLFILKHQNYIISLKALFRVLQNPLPHVPHIPHIPQSSTLPSVSFIFPTLNGSKLIRQAINSIKNQNYPKGKIETIVVDNASTDDTPDIIEKEFPDVRLIRLPTNTGSAPPITMGAKLAKGDYILATNDDVVFDKDCLQELVQLYLSDGRIGIATGKMMSMDKPAKPLCFGFRTNLYLGYYSYDYTGTNKVRECDWAAGACLLVRKDLMTKAGYFDDDYVFYGDDYDFCFQIRRLGYKILYSPKAVYYHGFTRTSKPNPERLFAHYRSKIRFMIKNASVLQMTTFAFFQYFVFPPYQLIKGKTSTFLPLIKGSLWNIGHLNQTLNKRRTINKLK